MFIASNQFRVARGQEEAFEAAWAETSARLCAAAGIIGFRCDKGKELHQHVLYFAVTSWESKICFLEWKRGELYGGYSWLTSSLAPTSLEQLDAMGL